MPIRKIYPECRSKYFITTLRIITLFVEVLSLSVTSRSIPWHRTHGTDLGRIFVHFPAFRRRGKPFFSECQLNWPENVKIPRRLDWTVRWGLQILSRRVFYVLVFVFHVWGRPLSWRIITSSDRKPGRFGFMDMRNCYSLPQYSAALNVIFEGSNSINSAPGGRRKM